MTLNADLFREILLFLEGEEYLVQNDEGTIESDPVWFGKIAEHFPEEKRVDLFYTLKNLEQAGYVNLSLPNWDGASQDCYVNFITFQGHEFLSSVKNEERWHGIKKALPAIRNYSLDAINAISQGLTSAAISAYLQKNP